MKTLKTFKATIHTGMKVRYSSEINQYDKVRTICQEYVDEKGECVSFTKTEYIYTNGNEPGCIVEFIQYPRFPREESEIFKRALELAEILMKELQQHKVTVICQDETYMLNNDSLKC